MSSFLALPQEITEQALINADVKDVTSVSQVCQALRRIVYGNESHVWRGLFMKIFDDPRKTRTYLTSPYAAAQSGHLHGTAPASHSQGAKYDWRGELQRRITARKVLLSPQHALNGKRIPRRERVKALSTIVDMVLAAVTVPPVDLPRSYDLEWVEDLLTKMDEAPYDGYGLYNPSPPSDLDTGRTLDGDGTSVFTRRPDLFTPRMPLPMGPRRRSASLSFLDDHIPYSPQPYFPHPSGHPPPSTLSPSLSQIKDSAEENSDHENNNNNDEDDNIDNKQYSLARERVLRARLRLLRGYSDRQKALVPMGPIDSQYDAEASHSRRLATDLRLHSRARVYDLRRYSPSNEWGPLMADPAIEGRVKVDWEQVDAVLVDTGMNIFDHIGHDHQNCPRIINPFGLESSRAYSAPGCEAHSLDFAPDGDWAGITGNWSRLISFCDYRDLRSYNVSIPSKQVLKFLIFSLICCVGAPQHALATTSTALHAC
jgi:hypothetical protein